MENCEGGEGMIIVAVNGSRNSKYAVKWALDKFVAEGINLFRLLHVRPKITVIPTPMREDLASAYTKEMEWKTNVMFLPYKQMCTERQVEAETVVIESDDIVNAISEEIVKSTIKKLVIGSSSRSTFTRKLKGDKTCSQISQRAPSFCTVYVVSKGKLSSVREPKPSSGESIRDDLSTSSISSSCRSSQTFSARSEVTDQDSLSNFSHFNSPSLQNQRNQALRAINQNITTTKTNSGSIHHSGSLSMSIDDDALSSSSSSADVNSNLSRSSSRRSIRTDYQSWNSDIATSSENITCSTAENQVDIGFELERLRIELRHIQGICEKVQNETFDASQKMNELTARRIEENQKLKEICLREMKARELATKESEAREAAEREAEFVKECAEREILQRRDAEDNAARDTEEKERLEKALSSCNQYYKKFEWEDIVSATSSFSDTFRIGMGANGIVYKGKLHHTSVAIKVLHSNEGYRTKQFNQELEILGRIRHPHLLLLLGACPEHGCLVYEYMENGSLDDRLRGTNNGSVLRWFHRFRIAWEVASALVFLHNTRPKPIVHRDLKPANILLDHNLLSKIGDVGLSTILPSVNSSMATMCKHTAPVGTFCYIDPEYQRTGVVSPKSDVYGLGMVILQLLTGKPPMGLAHIVETAIEDGCLEDVLDPGAGKWPLEEAEELASLGLSCAELRRKDRPDLQNQILPSLERLKRIADEARDLVQATSAPPDHFVCPINKEVMSDPCVGADGYTYDRKAIEMWFSMNDKSPLTNLQLPNKNLIPNHSLLSAIKDWKARND